MSITATKINVFLFLKLPAAFWCGVRAKTITDEKCTTTVSYGWRNQNPFKSIYFAVQAMAAELSTGALVMRYIRESGATISMLVLNNKANYYKKATGKITFTCNEGLLIAEAVQNAILISEGQTLWVKSTGTNEHGEIVSEMHFEWTLKTKADIR